MDLGVLERVVAVLLELLEGGRKVLSELGVVLGVGFDPGLEGGVLYAEQHGVARSGDENSGQHSSPDQAGKGGHSAQA